MEGPIDLDQLNSFIRIGDKRAFDTTLKGSVGRQLLPLDQDGFGPLHLAVLYQRSKMLDELLHQKEVLLLDVDLKSAEGMTAWEYASKQGYKKGLKLLIDAGCNHAQSICRDSDTSQSHQFNSTNSQHSQRHLEHPIKKKYWPLDICKKVVTGNFVRLTRELDTSSIIPVLIQKQILTTDEAYRIISLQSTTEKATYLLTFLPRKGSSGYRELFTALKEDSEQPAHQALGEELEEKCQELMEEAAKKSIQEDRTKEEFHQVDTIYTGSTTSQSWNTPAPTTWDSPHSHLSRRGSARPDSGFGSRVQTPYDQASPYTSSTHNSEASNFDVTSSRTPQQPPRSPYPVLNSVIGGTKRKSRRKSSYHVKDPTGSSCVLSNNGSVMSQQSQYRQRTFSDITEKDEDQDSNSEKDGCKVLTKGLNDSDDDDYNDAGNRHRSLPYVFVTHPPCTPKTSMKRTPHSKVPTTMNSSSIHSQLSPKSNPIDIPRKSSSSSLATQSSTSESEERNSSSSNQPESSPTPSSDDSNSKESPSQGAGQTSAAEVPKYLPSSPPPSRWGKLRDFMKKMLENMKNNNEAIN